MDVIPKLVCLIYGLRDVPVVVRASDLVVFRRAVVVRAVVRRRPCSSRRPCSHPVVVRPCSRRPSVVVRASDLVVFASHTPSACDERSSSVFRATLSPSLTRLLH